MKHPIDLPDEWSEEDRFNHYLEQARRSRDEQRRFLPGWWILPFAGVGFFLAAVIIAWLS